MSTLSSKYVFICHCLLHIVVKSATINILKKVNILSNQSCLHNEILGAMPLDHSKSVSIMSQWLLNLLPNQAWAAEMAAQDWFSKRFMNH